MLKTKVQRDHRRKVRHCHYLTTHTTEIQQEISVVLGSSWRLALRDILSSLTGDATKRSLKDDLAHLKRLELIDYRGRGRGARWFLI